MDGSTILDALADRTRRRLLATLTRRPMTVRALGAELGVTASAASQHLKILREAGLVVCRADGKQRLYRLAPAALESTQQAVAQLLRPPRTEPVQASGDDLRAMA